MIGGVTRHMLPHLPGVSHLHVKRPLFQGASAIKPPGPNFFHFNPPQIDIFRRQNVRALLTILCCITIHWQTVELHYLVNVRSRTITPLFTKTKEWNDCDYSLKKTISLLFDVHEPLIKIIIIIKKDVNCSLESYKITFTVEPRYFELG